MEILDDRAGARATLVTRQLPVEHWHAWIGDAAMADAMPRQPAATGTPRRAQGGVPARV